jgi:transcriptional regulator with XRE-family HTH domain
MPKIKNEVFVNVNKVEKILKANNIPQYYLGEMLGCSRTWWCNVKKNDGRISRTKANLLCNVLKTDLDYIAVSSASDTQEKNPHEDQISKEIMDAVSRIEKAVADLAGTTANEINRLQIQMRTILKEFGV